MKKTAVIAALALLVCAAGAWADHPDGWGIGIAGQYGGAWRGGGPGFNNLALSLKAPGLPVFWGINIDFFHTGRFGLGLTGDYYFIDQTLVPGIGLGWFLGIGGYGNAGFYTGGGKVWNSKDNRWEDYSQTNIGLGLRVPIGLNLVLAERFEFFLDLAPSLGLGLGLGSYYGSEPWQHTPLWLDGGWAGDFGFRIWI